MQLNTLRWHNTPWLYSENVPSNEKYWLTFCGSMTAKLENLFSQKIRINLILPADRQIDHYERAALALPPRAAIFIREVEIYVNNTLWMFARTAIPYASLQDNLRCLRYLGNRSLGRILFADPHLKRSHFAYTRLREEHRLFQKAIQNLKTTPNMLWARYSTFNTRNNVLLLTEVFMPAYFDMTGVKN